MENEKQDDILYTIAEAFLNSCGAKIEHYYDNVWTLEIELPSGLDGDENILFPEETISISRVPVLAKNKENIYFQQINGNSQEELIKKAMEIIAKNYISLRSVNNEFIALKKLADANNMTIEEYQKYVDRNWDN